MLVSHARGFIRHTGGICALLALGVVGIGCDKGASTTSASSATADFDKERGPRGSASAMAGGGGSQPGEGEPGREEACHDRGASAWRRGDARADHRPHEQRRSEPRTPTHPGRPPHRRGTRGTTGSTGRADDGARAAAVATLDPTRASDDVSPRRCCPRRVRLRPRAWLDPCGVQGSRRRLRLALCAGHRQAGERRHCLPGRHRAYRRHAGWRAGEPPHRQCGPPTRPPNGRSCRCTSSSTSSGSMQGAAIANAKKAAETLVEKLGPNDGLLDGHLLERRGRDHQGRPGRSATPADPHQDPRRAGDRGTNISAGLDLGYTQAHTPLHLVGRRQDRDAALRRPRQRRRHQPAGPRRAQRTRVPGRDLQTSSFGLGSDFDAPLMASFADRGAGGYYYLADSTQIAPALTQELEARPDPGGAGRGGARPASARRRPDQGVRIASAERRRGDAGAPQEVATDKQVEQRNRQSSRTARPTRGRHALLHAVLLARRPPRDGTDAAAARRYRRGDRSPASRFATRIASPRRTSRGDPVKVRYAGNDAESAATWSTSVRKTVQAASAGDAIMQAADLIERGDRNGAARLLNERAEILKAASSQLGEPAFTEDGMRLARLSGAVLGTGQVQDAVPLALMLRGSSYGYCDEARRSGSGRSMRAPLRDRGAGRRGAAIAHARAPRPDDASRPLRRRRDLRRRFDEDLDRRNGVRRLHPGEDPRFGQDPRPGGLYDSRGRWSAGRLAGREASTPTRSRAPGLRGAAARRRTSSRRVSCLA